MVSVNKRNKKPTMYAIRLDGLKQEVSRSMEEAIESLLVSYHELNPTSIDELTEAPSPLEFMRYAARNTPFVVRGGASQWPAFSWDLRLSRETDGDHTS